MKTATEIINLLEQQFNCRLKFNVVGLGQTSIQGRLVLISEDNKQVLHLNFGPRPYDPWYEVSKDDYNRALRENRKTILCTYYTKVDVLQYVEFTPEIKEHTEYCGNFCIPRDNYKYILLRNESIEEEKMNSKTPTTMDKPVIVVMKTFAEILTAVENELNCKLYHCDFNRCQYNIFVNENKTHRFMFDLLPHIQVADDDDPDPEPDMYLFRKDDVDDARRNHKNKIQTTYVIYDEAKERIRYIHYSPTLHYYVDETVCSYPVHEMKSIKFENIRL